MLPVRQRSVWQAPRSGFAYRGLSRDLDSLFDQVFGQDGPAPAASAWTVPLAVWEDDDNLHIEADLPGVTESDLEVTVDKDVLYLKGERKPAEGRTYFYNSGRGFGRFERALRLATPVAGDQVSATLSGGVLHVVLPKAPEAKPRRVEVRTN